MYIFVFGKPKGPPHTEVSRLFLLAGLLERSPFCNHLKHVAFSTPKQRETTIYKLQCHVFLFFPHQNKGRPPFTSCNVMFFVFSTPKQRETTIYKLQCHVFCFFHTKTKGDHHLQVAMSCFVVFPHQNKGKRPCTSCNVQVFLL